jgi:DNA helicase-2/ATP-dependent DNA helicase PcrA
VGRTDFVGASSAIHAKSGAVSDLRIPQEEERLLEKVTVSLAVAAEDAKTSEPPKNYSADLLQLRDDIAEARLEDVPALVAQMERLSAVAVRRAEVKDAPVDAGVLYFAHLRLREEGKERDVLIGRGTHIDSRNGVRIVDWRHAPISQLYYRYPEGSSYDEVFGDREVSGDVLVRRTVTIDGAKLLRVQAPQGTFVRKEDGWRSLDARTVSLSGGQGSAARPEPRGKLGVGPDGQQRLDRHLPEIAALLDPRQFELISAPSAGVVVIQGGAGSGKTTIGLHRMAYLAYRDRARFTPDRMLVITYGIALRAYISAVLPSLGVDGVPVVTLGDWAESLRKVTVPWLECVYDEETPSAVTKLKKHPALLELLIERGKAAARDPKTPKGSRGLVGVWSEVLTDLELLRSRILVGEGATMTETEVTLAHRWCAEKCQAVVDSDPRDRESPDDLPEESEDEQQRRKGIDGQDNDGGQVTIDREDDVLFLRLHQIMIGPLRKGRASKNSNASGLYEHLFVDEAQDLAPVELAVLLECTTKARSVTLAGDTAQKLFLDNGFSDWRTVLSTLGLTTTEIEPLRIAYRSTAEVLEFARDVLGPLADPIPPVANRHGAPVEAHVFPQAGAAVAFLADALRTLFTHEPRATVGILARFPEQADAYFEGLRRSEVPNLRRVRAQEFTFRPGVDVTEIKQVKGLEFDYVVIVDANESVFPGSDEIRHLLHIGATRAAHQLWILVTGKPSPLLSTKLLDG